MAGKEFYPDGDVQQTFSSMGSMTHGSVITQRQHSLLRGWVPFSHQRGWQQLLESLRETELFQKADIKTQEELLRTTQLVYSYQAGKMVPRLREPRQLFGFNAEAGGVNQGARWPSEIQVSNEKVVHILDGPTSPEPFYVKTGLEKTPMSRSHNGQGRIVYEYEPVVGSFFLRSRVGGCRSGCTQVAVGLASDEDKTLIFESRFESGNLFKAVQVGEFEYELWLRNDLYTNKHTQWFYFRVANTRANTTYRFTIVNLMKPDSLYNNGMKPLMYSERDAKENKVGWRRSGNEIKYYRNNIGYSMGKTDKWYYSLTWTCQFKYDRDTVYFSHCYPYTYTNMQDYLSEIASDPVRSKLCKQRVLCRTLAGNLVYVLIITSPTKIPEEMKIRKAVVLTSRVHPGESNSSWMMKGFLDYLLGSSADAKLLRDTFVFKIIPMLNPDGVIVGNYRCSLAGRDLNRNYKTVLKDSFPSVWHTKAMVRKLIEEREVIVYCDLHGHSRKHNVFIYGCENRGNPQRRLKERIFPVMLSKNAPDKFHFDYCKFKVQKSKEGTGRVVMWNMGILNSFTMEATFAGSTIGKKKGYHFSMSDFEAMGYHFCDTLLDYCDPDNSKCTNIILELEDKLRQEILQHLKQKEGQEVPDVTEINLDDAFTSDLESSDGGSDSSVSDGLPAHLQYIAQKTSYSKKKRLKTRKERDKHKCSSTKDDLKKSTSSTPVSMESDKKDLSRNAKTKTSSLKRPKSHEKTEKSNASTSTRDLPDDKSLNKVQPEGYLEALTNAYIRNGVINTDQRRDIPHFRYTAAGGHAPAPAEELCPHHDQTFAAQYMTNHLQQFKYPGPQAGRIMSEIKRLSEQESLLDVACAPPPSIRTPRCPTLGGQIVPQLSLDDVKGTRILKYSKRVEPLRPIERHLHVVHPSQAVLMQLTPNRLQDDLSELPKYKFQMRGSSAGVKSNASTAKSQSPSMLDKRSAGRHIVELAAAQTRQQELAQNEARAQDIEREETSSPIKQHPPPFDESLDKQHTCEFVKRGVSAKSVRATSGRPPSRSANSHSALGRPWVESQGLDGLVMLGPAEPGGHLWVAGAADQPGSAPINPDDAGAENNNAFSTEPRDVESRHGSAVSGRSRSIRGRQTPGEGSHSVPYVPVPATSKHNVVVPPSTNDYVQVKPKERTSLLQSHHQRPAPTHHQQLPVQSQSRAKPVSLHNTPPSSHVNGLDELTRLGRSDSQASDHKSSDSEQKIIHEQMSNTMQSINEISESLLDPSQRANLSPTTGNFVEHFVKKTEAEISDIAAELQQQLHNVQREGRSLPAKSDSPAEVSSMDFERSKSGRRDAASSDTSADVAYASDLAIVPKRATKFVDTEDGQSAVVTTYESSRGTRTGADGPAARTIQKRPAGALRDRFDRDRTMTTVGAANRTLREAAPRGTDWADELGLGQVALASVSLKPPAMRPFIGGGGGGKQRQQGADDGYSSSGYRDARPETEPAADGGGDDVTSARPDLGHSSGTTKRLSSSPTKISLMISRGHQREQSGNGNHGNQFHAYPLTRQPRPPVLRSMPKRR